MDTSVIEQAVSGFRGALQADGADLSVVTVADGRVVLRLEVVDATCAECVLPKHLLEAMLKNAIQERLGRVLDVTLDDPRENVAPGQ